MLCNPVQSRAILRGAQTVNRQHPLARGLGTWLMVLPGRSGGSTLYDLMGVTNGALTNMANSTNGFRNTSRVGGYGDILYDGSAGYVALGSTPASQISTTSTVMAWIYMTAAGSYPGIIARSNAVDYSTSKWNLSCVSNSHTLTATIGGTGIQSGGPTVPLSAWTLVAVVATPTAVTLYLNSGTGFSSTSGSAPTSPTYSTEVCSIGQWGSAGNQFTGRVDGVRIYPNRAFTAAELQQAFDNSQRGCPGLLNRVSRGYAVAAATAFIPWGNMATFDAQPNEPCRVLAY